MLEKMPFATLRELVLSAEELYRDRIAFRQLNGKEVQAYTYRDLRADVEAFALALFARGLEGKHIAILGENCYGWIVAYLASTIAGVAVPLDKELSARSVCDQLVKSDADVICTSKTYLKTAKAAQAENARLQAIFTWSDLPEETEATGFDALLAQGRALKAQGDARFLERKIDENAMAAILFTSGTTGANKGVMLSHKNICANLYSIVQIIPLEEPSMSILPFNHAFECNCHLLPAICLGVELCINSSLKRLMSNLALFKPGMTIVVPLFVDEVYARIINTAKKTGQLKMFRTVVAISDLLRRVGIDLRDKLFGELRGYLGGNLSLVICGGAPMNARTLKGLEDLGIDICPGYGITECSPLVSVNLSARHHKDRVGPPVPGVQVHIHNPEKNGVGEVWVKGDNVTIGYYKDEYSNSVSFEDGWFKTGDYGRIDYKGRLELVGRKKNLIILENGKNVYPEEIETAIASQLDYVRDVVVYEKLTTGGGKMQHSIAAAISLVPESDPAMMEEEARNEKIAQAIRTINKTLTSYKRVHMISVTLDEFEKTATRKVIRSRVGGQDQFIAL